MSKGLEALHHPRIELAKIDISVEGKHDIAYMLFYKTKQYTAIKKELKAFEIVEKFVKSISLKYIFCDDLVILIVGGDEFEWYYKCSSQEEYDLLKEVLL